VKGKVILFAEFTAEFGRADEIVALLSEYAETVRAEPGNILFEPARREDDSDSFIVYEQYRDRDAFTAHLAAPAGAAFNDALNRLIREKHSELTMLREFIH